MKKLFHIFSLIGVLFVLNSCNPLDYFKYYLLYLNVKDLDGLKEGAVILSKGNQVGKVLEVVKEEDGYIAVLSLNNDFLVPVNSEIRVVSDIENTSAYLEVMMSHSKRNYSEKDTINSHGTILLNKDIQLEEVKISFDSLPEGIQSLMQ